LETIFVAVDGQVSSTRAPADLRIWRLRVAAEVSVWNIQNPSATFKALSTAVHVATKSPAETG
jgi:hypothetical protein